MNWEFTEQLISRISGALPGVLVLWERNNPALAYTGWWIKVCNPVLGWKADLQILYKSIGDLEAIEIYEDRIIREAVDYFRNKLIEHSHAA